MRILIPLLIIVLIWAAIEGLGFGALYTVDETEFVVITRFGEVQSTKTSPGLSFKTPFVDTVVRFDNRLLRIDVPTASMPDRESQFLDIDAYVRYRINNPRKFLENLRDEVNASSTIGRIVIAAIRAEVGVRDREAIIGGDPAVLPDGTIIVAPSLTDGIPSREAMMQVVIDSANETVKSRENDFGIEVVDVRIKRADFPGAIENSVFGRMESERDVQAQRLRAEGEEEYLTITAAVTRDVEIIVAEADEQSFRLRGEGEAEAIRVLAVALEKDPEFFAFRRSLEAYTNFLTQNTTVVLSADSDLFRYLSSPNPASDEEDTAETEGKP